MGKPDPYREFLQQDFSSLFETLGLKENQKHYLRSRWLEQVLWMEGKAVTTRDWYYRLRLLTIIGGVIVPILVSLGSVNVDDRKVADSIRWATIGLSALVAASAAVEEFFHYGERWQHYRRSVESLKTQGWQFSQLTGAYVPYKTHEEAFNFFASQVENILQKDVEIYATKVVQSQGNQGDEEEGKQP